MMAMLTQAELDEEEAKAFDEHAGKDDETFVVYDPTMAFEQGVFLEHPEHGRGVVTKVLTATAVEVLFAAGRKAVPSRSPVA